MVTISPEPIDTHSDSTPDIFANLGDHRVSIVFRRTDTFPEITFRCWEPEGSVCRTTCLDTACEEGCVDTETHVRVPVDYCNIEEFLNNTADVEQAIFGGATMITRAVEVDWLSDRVEWRFA
jgi:hypothetical protein